MHRARIIGEVWATKKCPGLQGRKLLLVAPVRHGQGQADQPTPAGPVVVAIDLLDARVGEDVVVTYGSGARNAVRPGSDTNYDLMIDAAVVQITDRCFSHE